jgi:hypothetical protein
MITLAGVLIVAQLSQPSVPAQPLTLGRVAMLVNRTDADYRPLLREAIGDTDPGIRAVAARVVAVRRQGDMAGPLAEANARDEEKTGLRTGAVTVRTIPIIVPGLLASLVQDSRCKPGGYGTYGIARVTFDATGIGIRTEIDPTNLPGECVTVLSTAARLALADDWPATEAIPSGYVLLPMDRDFVACSNVRPVSALPTPGEPFRKVVPPRKISGFTPSFSRGATNGRVVVTAVITAKGCVQEASVPEPADPDLALAALRAVTAWRYKPARRGDEPVGSVMFVTMNFKH